MNTPSKISPHFHFHEFFSKGIWQSHDETFLRKLLDQRLVPIMERIRTELGKSISINTWWWVCSTSQYQGFRLHSSSVGALYCQHKLGRGVDFKVRVMSANKVRKYITDNEAEFFSMGLIRLEDGRDATI
ncbi:MAG: hypothetical protein ACJATI_001465 [Halioglobus sp.]|jgi:hypothetical protein